ncbi:MAG: glycosyltransferase [Verrucomicrobia bacterium]|nr:glycosyltransferase [Verrucomicrobiota bacterium]
MPAPRVSVITPIFNTEAYLFKAIDSILRQTFLDFELLLLDDGSSDRSVEIARQAATRDSRIVFVNGGRRGVVHARNLGVEMARGELVAMMDSDDIASLDRLACQVRFLDAHPECCAVGAQALRIDSDGAPLDRWMVPERHEDIDGGHMAGTSGLIINPTVMMRRHAVIRVGGYRAAFRDGAEDYDLFLRLAEVGQLMNLPATLLQYRVHSKCLSFTGAVAQRELVRSALEEAWKRRGKTGRPPVLPDVCSTPSIEELTWGWATAAYAARNFRTAIKHAFRHVRRRPIGLRRWILLLAACMGLLASQLRRILPCRIRSKGLPSGNP